MNKQKSEDVKVATLTQHLGPHSSSKVQELKVPWVSLRTDARFDGSTGPHMRGIAAPWRSSWFLLCPSNLSDKTSVREVCAGRVSEKHNEKYHVVEYQRFLGKKDLARKCARLALPCFHDGEISCA